MGAFSRGMQVVDIEYIAVAMWLMAYRTMGNRLCLSRLACSKLDLALALAAKIVLVRDDMECQRYVSSECQCRACSFTLGKESRVYCSYNVACVEAL